MNLKVTYPDDFPLHGLDRDMFETKLRSALRFCFYGNTVRQLAADLLVLSAFYSVLEHCAEQSLERA